MSAPKCLHVATQHDYTTVTTTTTTIAGAAVAAATAAAGAGAGAGAAAAAAAAATRAQRCTTTHAWRGYLFSLATRLFKLLD